jgi:serine protease Do
LSLGSPADRSGIRAGDFITHVDNIEMRETFHLIQSIGNIRPGDRAVFFFFFYGAPMEFNVRIEARADNLAHDNRTIWPGFMVVSVTDEIRSNFNLAGDTRGLLVSQVTNGTFAAIAGLRPGDIITRINETPVDSLLSFYKVLREQTEKELSFTFIRNGTTLNTPKIRR